MAVIGTVTVGDTRRQIVVAVTDENGNAVALNATASNHRLQGMSRNLPLITINAVASSVDGPQGRITFLTVGGLVTQANLTAAGMDSATFRLECKYQDVAGLVGFTEAFEYTWTEDPLQPA